MRNSIERRLREYEEYIANLLSVYFKGQMLCVNQMIDDSTITVVE